MESWQFALVPGPCSANRELGDKQKQTSYPIQCKDAMMDCRHFECPCILGRDLFPYPGGP